MIKNPASEFVFVRTYSKWIESEVRRENWEETVNRYITFIKKLRGDKIPPKVLRKIKEYMLSFGVMPSMRALWAAGDAAEADNVTMYNCAFSVIDSVKSFSEALYILMCGTGDGFSVQKKYVINSELLPRVKDNLNESLIKSEVDDSRAGWADSVQILMNALYIGKDVDFDYSKLRPKGAKLKTMGGRSSGPAPLITLHSFIREVFSKARGRKLTSLECHDIRNQIAETVVVGGVRRSSQVSLSDLDDIEMRTAKEWPFPQRRSMANNSAVYETKPSAVDFLKEWSALASSGTGERGIFNLEAARKNSPNRRDGSLVQGTNPCVTGDTEILTSNGYVRIDSVVDQEVEVWNGFEFSKVVPKITGKNQKILTISFNDGRILNCTPYHKFHIANGYTGTSKIIEAKDLDSGMKIIKHNFPIIEHGEEYKYAYTQGFISAEGMDGYKFLSVYEPKKMCIPRLDGEMSSWNEKSKRGHFRFKHEPLLKSFVPFNWNLKSKLEWLAGLFDGDGCELREGGLQLVSVDRTFLRETQSLLSTIGIQSKVTLASLQGNRLMPDGRGGNREFLCKETNRILIGATQMQQLKKLGLKCERLKFDKTPQRDASQFITIVDINESDDAETVYCFNEPKRHMGVFNGVLTGQCGEISLRNKQFCNLSEIVVRKEDDLDTLLQKVETATWIGVIQSTFTYFPYLSSEWKSNCDEERLLGVSITGQMDNPELITPDNLKAMKAKALKVAKHASIKMGITMPTAITCVKPSGCRPWNAVTTTDCGIFTLEELLENHTDGKEWSNLNKDIKVLTPKGVKSITKTYDNGKSEVLEIIMSYGLSVQSTPNHKWYVLGKKTGKGKCKIEPINKWIESKNILKDYVLQIDQNVYNSMNHTSLLKLESRALKMRKDCESITQPEQLNEDISWLLGYLWGDGAMSPMKYRIRFVDQNLFNLEKAQKIINQYFGIKSIVHKASENRNAFTLDISSKMLWHWLIKNDVWKYFADKLDIIPKCVRTSSKNDIISFIAGLIDSDGWTGISKEGVKKATITTADKEFSKHLQHIAWSVGICLGRSLNSKGKNLQKHKEIYLMSIAAISNIESCRTLIKNSNKMSRIDLSNGRWFFDKGNKSSLIIPGIVTKNEQIESMETFDIEVDEVHEYYNGSVRSHNTVSQLVDSSSGIHPRYAKHYIRRYRIASTDPLFKMMKTQGFKFNKENGQEDLPESEVNTWVVGFPIKSPEGCVTRHDMTALDQLEWYKKIQTNWCEHNASMTCYVDDGEWFEVGNWVYKNWDIVNGISFLPKDNGKYKQAPYEEINEDKYLKLVENLPKVDYSKLSQFELEDSTEGGKTYSCVGDRCELV